MLLYWMYNPAHQHIYSGNNTEDEGRGVEKGEDDEKKRKTHEILVEGVTGGYKI
jgi:hypothetical protein